MSFDAERAALEFRFETNWSQTDIKWPNVKFSSKDRTEWVAFNNVTDDGKEKSMGNNPILYRYFGDIVIQIFVMPNSGATRALQLADLVSDIWRNAKFSGITIKSVYTVTVGVVDGWYQLDVISPYYRDSIELRSVL